MLVDRMEAEVERAEEVSVVERVEAEAGTVAAAEEVAA